MLLSDQLFEQRNMYARGSAQFDAYQHAVEIATEVECEGGNILQKLQEKKMWFENVARLVGEMNTERYSFYVTRAHYVYRIICDIEEGVYGEA